MRADDPQTGDDLALLEAAGDLGAEGLRYLTEGESPNGRPLLLTANEVSGTLAIFEVVKR